MDLTLKELIILIVVVAVVALLVVSIIKSSIKLAMVAIVISVLFSGFTWLPEKIIDITGIKIEEKEVKYNDFVETVSDFINVNISYDS